MNDTLLTHIGCLGKVVLDPSMSMKLVAPSFALTESGIVHVTFDLHMEAGKPITPIYFCVKCATQISNAELDKVTSAFCIVCGEAFPLEELNINNKLSCVCNTCVDNIKNSLKQPSTRNKRYADYARAFNITANTRFKKLADVLIKPFSL